MQQIAKNRAGFLLFSGFCLLAASCKGTGGMGLGAAPVPAAKTSDPLLNSGSYNSEPARATAGGRRDSSWLLKVPRTVLSHSGCTARTHRCVLPPPSFKLCRCS